MGEHPIVSPSISMSMRHALVEQIELGQRRRVVRYGHGDHAVALDILGGRVSGQDRKSIVLLKDVIA